MPLASLTVYLYHCANTIRTTCQEESQVPQLEMGSMLCLSVLLAATIVVAGQFSNQYLGNPYYPSRPTHKPPFDEELLKLHILTVPLTVELCKQYRQLRKYKACQNAISYQTYGNTTTCPAAASRPWGSRYQANKRSTRSTTGYYSTFNLCKGAEIEYPIMRACCVQEGRDCDLYQCVPGNSNLQSTYQFFVYQCNNAGQVFRCNYVCRREHLLMRAVVYDQTGNGYHDALVELPLTCCLHQQF